MSVTANTATHGSTPAEAATIHALWLEYDVAYNDVIPEENAYRAAVSKFDDKVVALVSEVPSLIAKIHVDSDLTDAARTSAGLAIRKTTRSHYAVPTTQPVCEVDISQRHQHTIAFRDEGSDSKAKPGGGRACEIWVVIGTGPASVAVARYLATDSATPYVANYEASDSGESANYRLRWANTQNQQGPWSSTVTVTIGG